MGVQACSACGAVRWRGLCLEADWRCPAALAFIIHQYCYFLLLLAIGKRETIDSQSAYGLLTLRWASHADWRSVRQAHASQRSLRCRRASLRHWVLPASSKLVSVGKFRVAPTRVPQRKVLPHREKAGSRSRLLCTT